MGTVKYVSENKKEKFLKSVNEIIKKDPRLNINIINRMLDKGVSYINSLSRGEKLNHDVYHKWFDEVCPKLEERVKQYSEIPDDILDLIVKNAVSTQRSLIAHKMGVLESRVQSISTSGSRSKKLDIYDVVMGNPLYPKNSLPAEVPQYVIKISELIKKLSQYGITQNDASDLIGVSSSVLQNYRRPRGKITSTQRIFKSKKIITDLEQLLTYSQQVKSKFASLVQAKRQREITEENIQEYLNQTHRDEKYLKSISNKVRFKRELGCYIYITYPKIKK